MKHSKKLLSLLLTASMAISLIPATVMADTAKAPVNNVPAVSFSLANRAAETPAFNTYEEAAEYIATEMVGGAKEIPFKINLENPIDASTQEALQQNAGPIFNEIISLADAALSTKEKGDYLRYTKGRCRYGMSASPVQAATSVTFTYKVVYRVTDDELQETEAAMDAVLTSLDLDNKTKYEQFIAIYDYIVKNTIYSHNVPGKDPNDQYEYTAYAALIKHTAVCQGYATLLNRMLEKVGIKSRIISGWGRNEAHAWNIVEIDKTWYNVDATWDNTGCISYKGSARYYPMSYRLKGDADFPNHTRDAEYLTSAFTTNYNTSGESYVIEPSFLGHALTITDDIAVKFLVDIPAGIDLNTVYVDFTIASGRSITLNISEADPLRTDNGLTYYMFVFDVNALEIADNITATLHYGENNTITDTYSVLQYCDDIREREALYGSQAVALVNSIQDYGHYLQGAAKFGWTDKRNHTAVDAKSEINADTVEQVKPELAAYKFVRPSTSIVEDVMYSLVLKSDVTIKLYFKLADGYHIGDETTTIEGETWYVVRKGPLGPLNFDDEIKLLTDGGYVSVLAYANAIINMDSMEAEKKYVMVAMYQYYLAAENYSNRA